MPSYAEDYLRARITSALGGRAAEKLIHGVVTTGAENDLQQVTEIARHMVLRWGMSEKLGPISFVAPQDAGLPPAFQQQPYSEATSELIDAEVRRIVEECHREADPAAGSAPRQTGGARPGASESGIAQRDGDSGGHRPRRLIAGSTARPRRLKRAFAPRGSFCAVCHRLAAAGAGDHCGRVGAVVSRGPDLRGIGKGPSHRETLSCRLSPGLGSPTCGTWRWCAIGTYADRWRYRGMRCGREAM
jgi:Peptidase family M41